MLAVLPKKDVVGEAVVVKGVRVTAVVKLLMGTLHQTKRRAWTKQNKNKPCKTKNPHMRVF